ncbi:hypothetical protein M407DRAFT_93606 [Tulasnella calospora MUT 4182]|uniref:Uncharacterized protein n=1 Tax=Tulasnella calospora MUT 4182 TaxID=1051891 RepID=A0A0C3QG60_9AGAM|nr:hypothetical protein M407DRAFT_93606 [Tulasnella calospora MUT 4182]
MSFGSSPWPQTFFVVVWFGHALTLLLNAFVAYCSLPCDVLSAAVFVFIVFLDVLSRPCTYCLLLFS